MSTFLVTLGISATSTAARKTDYNVVVTLKKKDWKKKSLRNMFSDALSTSDPNYGTRFLTRLTVTDSGLKEFPVLLIQIGDSGSGKPIVKGSLVKVKVGSRNHALKLTIMNTKGERQDVFLHYLSDDGMRFIFNELIPKRPSSCKINEATEQFLTHLQADGEQNIYILRMRRLRGGRVGKLLNSAFYTDYENIRYKSKLRMVAVGGGGKISWYKGDGTAHCEDWENCEILEVEKPSLTKSRISYTAQSVNCGYFSIRSQDKKSDNTRVDLICLEGKDLGKVETTRSHEVRRFTNKLRTSGKLSKAWGKANAVPRYLADIAEKYNIFFSRPGAKLVELQKLQDQITKSGVLDQGKVSGLSEVRSQIANEKHQHEERYATRCRASTSARRRSSLGNIELESLDVQGVRRRLMDRLAKAEDELSS